MDKKTRENLYAVLTTILLFFFIWGALYVLSGVNVLMHPFYRIFILFPTIGTLILIPFMKGNDKEEIDTPPKGYKSIDIPEEMIKRIRKIISEPYVRSKYGFRSAPDFIRNAISEYIDKMEKELSRAG